jgi:hypothetical protein
MRQAVRRDERLHFSSSLTKDPAKQITNQSLQEVEEIETPDQIENG